MSSPPGTDSQDSPNSAKPAPAAGRFTGKVALITGASDRGIGGEIAVRLATDGAKIAVLTRHEPVRLIKKLSRLGHGHSITLGDVTKSADIARAIDELLVQFGRLDVLVNNAGIELASPLETFADDEWERMLAVNLTGAIALTKAALPKLSRPGGVIVNIASALGLGGCPGFSIYSATKAGLIGFTQSLAWEVAREGIRVVAVAPGLVHTPMVHKHVAHLTPEIWAQIEACHPLGMGRPDDVAAAVAFLASSDARWITGVTLPLGWAHHYPLPTGQMMAGGGARG